MKNLVCAFGLSIGILSAAMATADAQRRPTPPELPAPTGNFGVGRAEFHWIDPTRTDPFSLALADRREVVVYLWYPTSASPGVHRAEYLPGAAEISRALGEPVMRRQFGSAFEALLDGTVRSFSVDRAPVARSTQRFPVLLFSPGFAETVLTYAAQVEELASHGYVVVGIEHPGDAFATRLHDGRVAAFRRAAWDSARAQPNGAVAFQLAQIPIRVADMRFVLDQLGQLTHLPGGRPFAAALDLHKVGAFGHSLGGVAAAGMCRVDARVAACMNEDAEDDGRPFDGGMAAAPIKQPFFFFATRHSIYLSARQPPQSDADLARNHETRAEHDALIRIYQENQDRSLASMPGGAIRVMAEADDFTHGTFIDRGLLESNATEAPQQLQYLALIRRYTRAFFDQTLRAQLAPMLSAEGPVDSLITVNHFRGDMPAH